MSVFREHTLSSRFLLSLSAACNFWEMCSHSGVSGGVISLCFQRPFSFISFSWTPDPQLFSSTGYSAPSLCLSHCTAVPAHQTLSGASHSHCGLSNCSVLAADTCSAAISWATRREFIAINIYLKGKKVLNNLTLHLKEQQKEGESPKLIEGRQ